MLGSMRVRTLNPPTVLGIGLVKPGLDVELGLERAAKGFLGSGLAIVDKNLIENDRGGKTRGRRQEDDNFDFMRGGHSGCTDNKQTWPDHVRVFPFTVPQAKE
mmetsp:Transcript_12464/g.23291  ORF Transcript_12464/g.23291 Transcript_12464/m.23291 type:complete len:103 (-) Transcript_12464:247-555(-)